MNNFLDIDKVRSILDEVNGMIETTLLLTRDDIGKVMTMIKNAGKREASQKTVSVIVERLQNFDIFEQRLRHIVELNVTVPTLNYDVTDRSAVPIARNIFRLNQLQYEMAWSDYLQAISQLKLTAQAFDVRSLAQFDFASTGILTKAAMHLTTDKFEKAILLTSVWNPVRLERYLPHAQRIYSTEKERQVLLRYQENPVVTLSDINVGMIAGENNSSSIELF
jgi:hypothetical protein